MALRSPSPVATSRPAPAPPPTPPSARRPDAPRRAAQDAVCAMCVGESTSGNRPHCQCKQSSNTQYEVHHDNEAMARGKRISRPNSSDKHRMPRSSGGKYSKPDARVKLIPAEEITYRQHRKPYCRTIGSSGLQKRPCRRSVTPPPSSRKVSLVGSTPLIQNPRASGPSYNSSSSPKRLETAENGHSCVGEYMTNSISHHIASPKNPAPPSCKSSDPSSTSLNTDSFARNLGRMGITEAFTRFYGSRILSYGGQSSEKPPASLPKEAAINPISPGPQKFLAARSSEDRCGTKAGPSSKSVCTSENGKLYSRSRNLVTRSPAAAVLQSPGVEPSLLSPTSVLGETSTQVSQVYPDRIRTAAPILQKKIVKHVLPSPKSLLSERTTEVYPNSKSGAYPSTNLLSGKCDPASVQRKNIPPIDSLQSIPPAQCDALSKERNPVASINCDTSPGERSTEVYPNSKSGVYPSTNLLSGKCDPASVQHKNIPPTDSPQSMPPAQCDALSKGRNPVASINCDTSPGERSTEVYPNSKSGVCTSTNLLNGKCDLAMLQNKNIPPTYSLQSTAPAQCSALSNERNTVASINGDTSSEFRHESIDIQETGLSIILHSKPQKRHYQSEARWKGNFHVTGELGHTCDGLEAHFPFEIDVRAYEASKQMPGNLNLEAVPLSQLWPKTFKMKPPDGHDIGLWFISSHQRPHRSFDHLLEKLSSRNGLCTNIGNVELAIFSSKLLTTDYQRKDGKFYFWGVFGKRLRKKQRQPNCRVKNMKISNPCQPNQDSCDKSGETGMRVDATEGKDMESVKSKNGMTLDARGGEERDMGMSEEIGNPKNVTGGKVMVRDKTEEISLPLDLTGGNKTERVNEGMTLFRIPDSNPASRSASPASFLDGCCSPDSSNSPCQPASRSPADSDLVLGTPPGFFLDLPPGFTKAHQKLSAQATAVSSMDAFPSLVLDTPAGFPTDIPPGFTEAHRQLPTITSAGPETGASAPVSEKSMDAFPSLVLDTPAGFPTDIPPGFTEVHRQLPTITSAGPETGASTPVFEKKPFIGLSPNIPRPVRTEVPPVFTALLAVKQESVSPAVGKAIEKRMPSSLASGASSSPSLVLDTPRLLTSIPPGFTEAHRQFPTITSAGPETSTSIPVTEKKSLISFSLNVPKPVRTEVPLGFASLLPVKKEPWLPAVEKAIEKEMPSSLASGASSVKTADVGKIRHHEVRAESDEGSEEREFPKSRLLSDILGLSSASSDGNARNTPNSTPRNRTEVGRPVSGHLSYKHQEMEAPEKQVHRRKRCSQEPPEPSPADTTTKRPNVNGRIALNNGVDRQVFNPNRDEGRRSSL